MTERALAARILTLLLAVSLAGAALPARGEAVLEPTVGTPSPPDAEPEFGDRAAPAPDATDRGATVPDPPAEPAADAPAQGSAAAPSGPPPKRLVTLAPNEASGILGKQVIGAEGENIGMVVDVLIDSEGEPRAAVIDFGGFLGVGNRRIAVDWTLLQFRPGDNYAPILLDVAGDAIRNAPEFRPTITGPGVVVSPPPPPPLPAGGPPALEAPTPGAPPGSGTPSQNQDGALPGDVQDLERLPDAPLGATGAARPDSAPAPIVSPEAEMRPPDRPVHRPEPATESGPDNESVSGAAPAQPSAPPDAGQ